MWRGSCLFRYEWVYERGLRNSSPVAGVNRRFGHRVFWMLVFLVLFNVFLGVLPRHIAPYGAPLLAGVVSVGLSYAYRAWVQRRG